MGYGPADLHSAYALPTGSQGSGLTVALVDAYDLPSAEADLAVYRTQFGLSPCTTANGCFRKVDQNGGTSYPGTNAGWAAETALDMDMVSAICPNCKILLVEANTNGFANLGTSVDTAVSLGAIAVSNSYGGAESASEATSYDPYYNHPGVAVTVSTGDCGYGCSSNLISAAYPAVSPNVIAVGGTSLTSGGGTRGWTESAWGVDHNAGAGSGCSAYEPKPSWQHDSGCANRTIADVSAVAAPATGVAVYVNGGWSVYGGTSASSPIIASVFALAGRPAPGTYPASYLYKGTAHLYDVKSGSNDIWETTIVCTVTYLCNGVAGYDGPTGLGTPNGVGAFKAPPATHFSVATANPWAAGAAHSVTVKALDAYGNVATGYHGTVHFTSSDPAAVLPADYTFTSGDAGVHRVVVTLKTAGSRTVTATDKTTSSIKGTGSAITVTPAAAKTFTLTGAVPWLAGASHSVTVTARDAYGNVATAYVGTVHLTSSDPAAVLPANYTFVVGDAGVHKLTVKLKTVGSRWVRATDTHTATITGSVTITVS